MNGQQQLICKRSIDSCPTEKKVLFNELGHTKLFATRFLFVGFFFYWENLIFMVSLSSILAQFCKFRKLWMMRRKKSMLCHIAVFLIYDQPWNSNRFLFHCDPEGLVNMTPPVLVASTFLTRNYCISVKSVVQT